MIIRIWRGAEIMDIVALDQHFLHLNKIHAVCTNVMNVVLQNIDVLRFNHHEPIAPGRHFVVLKGNAVGADNQKRPPSPIAIAGSIKP